MSKAVKSIGRSIGKVVKGVVGAVKKVAKSKLGKLIIMAAAVYFGGAALMGATSSAAGSSALTGISNAWTSLGTAMSQAGGALVGAEGASFANAASALGTGIQGGAATMANGSLVSSGLGGISASTAPMAGIQAPGLQASGAVTSPVTNTLSSLQPMSATTGLPVAPPPAASSGFFSSDLAKYGAISAGSQLAGGLIQGAGAQKQYEQQMADAEALRAAQDGRYRSSVDEYGRMAQAGAAQYQPGQYQPTQRYDPVAGAPSIADRYAPLSGGPQTTGLVARGMQYQQPEAGNGFPVYNPMYYRG